jgi:hypothetical protein
MVFHVSAFKLCRTCLRMKRGSLNIGVSDEDQSTYMETIYKRYVHKSQKPQKTQVRSTVLLTETPPTAIAGALVRPNPALVAIGVLACEPAVQGLLQVIQVLGVTVTLALGRARVVLRQALVAIQTRAGLEPAVVATDGGEGVVARVLELRLQVVRAGVDVILDRVGAYAVWVVCAGDLHQTRRRPSRARLARRLLHGNEGEDDRVDAVAVAADLEVLVVLLAAAAGAGIESCSVDVVQGGEVQEGWVPAVTINSSVEPILRSRAIISVAGLP